MAIQTIRGGMWLPEYPTAAATTLIATSGLVIDAADEKAAFIFRSPVTGVIDQIEFRTGTVTTGATVDVRLETVDAATGDPSGTLATANSNASVVIADADDSAWKTGALTATHSATKGDLLAIVIVNPSVSFGNMQIALFDNDADSFPYVDLYTGTWAKTARPMCATVRYQTTTYHPIVSSFPLATVSNLTYNVDTVAQDEAGLFFQVPFPCRVARACVWCDLDGDANVVLYDSDGSTVMTSVSLDKDVRSVATPDLYFAEFTGTATLVANTNYRCVLKPTTTTNVILGTITTSTAGLMDTFPGGQNFHYTSRVDAGAWTQTTTRRPTIYLCFDGFDDAASSGGGQLVNSGLVGG